MSVTERTKYRRSPDFLAFDDHPREPQHAPCTSKPSTDFSVTQTYDAAVFGVRDTRSITPDPVMARDWYRKAASFGSADAQQRLTQLQN